MEKLWVAIGRLDDTYCNMVEYLRLLDKDGFARLFREKEYRRAREIFRDAVRSWPATSSKHKETMSSLHGTEMFYVSSKMWLYYDSIYHVYARLALLMSRSLGQSRFQDWRDDDLMQKTLLKAFSTQRVDEARQEIGDIYDLILELKAGFVAEGRSLVSGRSQLSESVSEIHEILRSQTVDSDRERLGL